MEKDTFNYLDDVGEPYSTGERVAVVYDRLPVVAVPAVQLNAPTALTKVVDIPERQDRTGRDKTGQDRTGQDKTGQDETRRDNVSERQTNHFRQAVCFSRAREIGAVFMRSQQQ